MDFDLQGQRKGIDFTVQDIVFDADNNQLKGNLVLLHNIYLTSNIFEVKFKDPFSFYGVENTVPLAKLTGYTVLINADMSTHVQDAVNFANGAK